MTARIPPAAAGPAARDPRAAGAAGPSWAIEASELTKRFRAPVELRRLLRGEPAGGVTAVDRVSFAIREGEIFGLVGPNGAGKTTLIKLLCGLYLPTSGRARVCGRDTVTDDLAVRRQVGLVTSNERSFFWRLTGLQNLEFFAHLYRLPGAEAREWIAELLEVLDLGAVARARFDRYSTGIKQRFAIARGLLSKPRILFMDEPTKGVDPAAADHLIEVLRERVIRRWAPTVLVTSHNLREIERLCERVAIMDRGRIAALGTLEELRARARTLETFRLTVRRLSEERLMGILALDGLAEPPRIVSAGGPSPESGAGHNGAREVEVRFRRGADGFARLVRAIVEGGGDIEGCTRLEPGLDEAFLAILSGSARPASGAPEGARP